MNKTCSETIDTYLNITLTWFFISFIASQSFLIFLLIITIPFSLIFLIVGIIELILKEKKLKEISLKLLIIIICSSIIIFIHHNKYEHARKDANNFVEILKAYKSKHGAYPKQLSDMNLTDKSFYDGEIVYTNEVNSDEPTLSYLGTNMLYESYTYDFKKSTWTHNLDY